MTSRKYSVTKQFTSGNLEGLTITEQTDVNFPVGFVCDKPCGGSPYVITGVIEQHTVATEAELCELIQKHDVFQHPPVSPSSKISATELTGSIRIVRERDIRRRGKPFNDMVECDPVNCSCCGREIYKIAELVNGDILGSECACVIGSLWGEYPQIMRRGRFLNKRQQEYARKHGLLA